MERHNCGEARVIPVILRPVMWEIALFGRLQALPTDGKPVNMWKNQDEAFRNVAEGIRRVVDELRSERMNELQPLLTHSHTISTYVHEEVQMALGAVLGRNIESVPPANQNIVPPLPPKSVVGSETFENKRSTMADHEGRRFGNYRLIRLLGQGGFANVYLGEHIYLGKRAAIKVLNAQLTADGVQKFGLEAQTVARLEHPNIVKVLEFGFADTNTPFLVMDFAPYGSLRYPKGTKLPEATVASYVRQIAAALQYAHVQGVIHRDVKPENMLVGKNNEVLLGDFGIAVVETERSQKLPEGIAGTIAYMAPEQIVGQACAASDQYSLGVVVYEWLCGERPFKGTLREIVAQHQSVHPRPLSQTISGISPDIDRVVMKALAKNPEERYVDMLAFASALRHASTKGASHRETQISEGIAALSHLPAPVEENADTTAGRSVPAAASSRIIELSAFSGNKPGDQSMKNPPANDPKASQQPPIEGNVPQRDESPGDRSVSRRKLFALVGTGVAGGILAGIAADRFVLPHPVENSTSRTSSLPATPTSLTLPYVFFGHFSEVNSVAWSPDGRRIASGSRDWTAKVWDVLTGKNILTYTNHNDWVNAVAWSLDSKLVASGSADDTIQIWDATTGVRIHTYTGHTASVQTLAWSPDGTMIASGSYDATVRVLNLASAQVQIYTGHTAEVDAVVWSPNGKFIASGGGKIGAQHTDTTVQVWEAATLQRVLTYSGHLAQVDGLAWSPDGGRIASASYDTTVQVWDAATGNSNSAVTYHGHHYPVRAVAWSPDGTLIASASADHTVQVWDAKSGSTIFTYHGHHNWVHTVAWSPSGKLIASGSADQTVQIWVPQE